jgi:formylglycine-generating enzyme required for sulfatase activity
MEMIKRFLILLVVVAAVLAQDTLHRPEENQIAGPRDAGDFDAWLRDLKIWRAERLTRMGYNDTEYARTELQWAQRDFVQPQMMCEERYFYDPVQRRYTVDRYLDDLEKRYGGIDSVLIWPVYPNIGIDNRNEWDLHRDLPGGIPALKKMVEDFHRRGVRVLFPTMPWDNGTRDPGMPHWEATAKLMAEIGADGANGDTFSGLPRTYRTASDATGHPIVFQPEGAPASDEGLMWNNQSWLVIEFGFAPPASKLKWLEPRHMIDVVNRWGRDHTDDLQYAFFNGVGFESWENIWGIWNQMTPRDGEALRRISRIDRNFAELLVSKDWVPHHPTMQYGIFSSMFPGSGRTLWTLVNRNEFDVAGPQLKFQNAPGRRYYDIWHGVEIQPEVNGPFATLSFPMEAHGFGAILLVEAGTQVEGLDKLLALMKASAAAPIQSLSAEWKVLPQKMVEIRPTVQFTEASAGMVKIPAGEFLFKVSGVEIEGSDWIGLDVQYPWENSPRRSHATKMQVKSFYMDKYPVTNAEFLSFVENASYKPADDHNFLRDWKDGRPQPGWENKPVTWVSLEDARAYAQWARKRLPHEWEWQYAAQGADERVYPWGNQWDDAAVPEPYKGRDLPGQAAVDAHPRGASPFGVMDMVGNVWQWTDEFVDEHTRAAILRGGSYYQPQGSIWYFPQAYKLTEHGKYLLMAPSKDRAATLGFRCVRDGN